MIQRRPSIQWYFSDWRNNAKLRRCSEAARGAWVDLLGVLHDSDEYGICRWPLEELIRASGVSRKSIKELLEKKVLKGVPAGERCEPVIYIPRSGRKNGNPVILLEAQDGPIWYCSRFIRDEYLRVMRADGGKNYGQNDAPKYAPDPSPKGGIGEGSGAHLTHHPSCARPSSSSSSSSAVVDTTLLNADARKSIFGCIEKIAPHLLVKNPSAVDSWIASGADAELDIIPTIKRLCKAVGADKIQGFSYFSGAIEEAKKSRESPPPLPQNNAQSPHRSGAGSARSRASPHQHGNFSSQDWTDGAEGFEIIGGGSKKK